MNGRRLYALLTTQCNLTCPHCDVKTQDDNYDEEKFMKQLSDFNGNIVIMGGEPSLYEDRLEKAVTSQLALGKHLSLTTNLIKLNDHLIELYKKIPGFGTSWNAGRFTPEQYKIWLSNLGRLKEHHMKISALVTLDHDLIKISPEDFLKTVHEWDPDVMVGVKFEQLVAHDNSPEWFESVDEWFSHLYTVWDSPISIINTTYGGWYFDCTGTYTLYPDGRIKVGCMHESSFMVPKECYTCEYAAKCKPCIKQKYCSYPKKFYELVNKDKEKKEENKDDEC